MPNSVTSLGGSAFRYCSSLTFVDLRSVTTIGDYAFYNCSLLASVDLGSATSIGNGAFSGCPSLNSVTYNRISVASADDDLVIVDSAGNVVDSGPTTITKNDGGFLTQ